MTSDSNDNSNIQAAGSSEPAAVACEGGACEAACAEPTVAEAGASYRRDGNAASSSTRARTLPPRWPAPWAWRSSTSRS